MGSFTRSRTSRPTRQPPPRPRKPHPRTRLGSGLAERLGLKPRQKPSLFLRIPSPCPDPVQTPDSKALPRLTHFSSTIYPSDASHQYSILYSLLPRIAPIKIIRAVSGPESGYRGREDFFTELTSRFKRPGACGRDDPRTGHKGATPNGQAIPSGE